MTRKCICDEHGTVCLKHKAEKDPVVAKNLQALKEFSLWLDEFLKEKERK